MNPITHENILKCYIEAIERHFINSVIMFEPYYSLLPPHWSYREDSDTYFNEISHEETSEHPITIFMRARQEVINPPENDDIGIEIERIAYEKEMAATEMNNEAEFGNTGVENTENVMRSPVDIVETSVPNPDNNSEKEENINEKLQQNKQDVAELELPTGKFYEYHCQWNERDLFGKVSLYGLTFRYYVESHKTLIKFDGLVGEWVYSVLQGPYGPLEHIDFFIGAKIKVFGRQVTISSASGSSIKWIENERKKLERQQNRFREKIVSVGQVPCVRARQIETVRHITRGSDTGVVPGHTDLRKLLQHNARLGEQLVSLGLCDQL